MELEQAFKEELLSVFQELLEEPKILEYFQQRLGKTRQRIMFAFSTERPDTAPAPFQVYINPSDHPVDPDKVFYLTEDEDTEIPKGLDSHVLRSWDVEGIPRGDYRWCVVTVMR